MLQLQHSKTSWSKDRFELQPEVVNGENGCIGILPGTKRHPGQTSRPINLTTKRVRSVDVVQYADDMYDGMYFPNAKEEKLASLHSTFRLDCTLDSTPLPKYDKQLGKLGRLHKVHVQSNTACQTRSKVNFDEESSLRYSTSLSNRSYMSKEAYTDSMSTTPRDQACEYSNKERKNEILGIQTEKTISATEKVQSLPLLYFQECEEVDRMVQTEIQKHYSFESLKANRTRNSTGKLFSSNPKAKIRDVGLNDTKKESETELEDWRDSCKSEEDLEVIETPVKGTLQPKRQQHYEEGYDIYLLMKQRSGRDERNTTKDTVNSSKSVPVNEVPIGETSDDDSSDHYEGVSEFYSTATILGEENRQVPETLVVVTGRVQGLQVKEMPREPLGRQVRTYLDQNGDDRYKLKDSIPRPKPKLRKRPKVGVSFKYMRLFIVGVSFKYMKLSIRLRVWL